MAIEFEEIYITKAAELVHSSMIVHCLLHVAQCIRQNGPLMSYSQFTCERFIGSLKRTIKSDAHPFANLLNNTKSREYSAVIRQNCTVSVKAEHHQLRALKSRALSVNSYLYGSMFGVPLDDLQAEERESLRQCYPGVILEQEFNLERSELWQNYKLENGDLVGSLLDIKSRNNSTFQRRFVKVSDECAAEDGSRYAQVQFYYLLRRDDEQPQENEHAKRDVWARISYLKADSASPDVATVTSCENWQIEQAGDTIMNFGITCWVAAKDIVCLIGTIQLDRKLYVIDRTLLSRDVVDSGKRVEETDEQT